MENNVTKHNSNEVYLYKEQQLSPHLKGVHDRFNMKEEFKTFMRNNQDVGLAQQHIDAAFLLFLLEQQRMAIINLEERVTRLEKYREIYYNQPNPEYDKFIKESE